MKMNNICIIVLSIVLTSCSATQKESNDVGYWKNGNKYIINNKERLLFTVEYEKKGDSHSTIYKTNNHKFSSLLKLENFINNTLTEKSEGIVIIFSKFGNLEEKKKLLNKMTNLAKKKRKNLYVIYRSSSAITLYPPIYLKYYNKN